MKVSKNKEAERICGRRPRGNAVFEPHELGHACPICGASNEVDLQWSEYNFFIWCRKCNLDIPSCFCMKYCDISSKKTLNKRDRVIENTRIFLDCLKDIQEAYKAKIEKIIREAETSNDMWKLTPEELLRKYLKKLEEVEQK